LIGKVRKKRKRKKSVRSRKRKKSQKSNGDVAGMRSKAIVLVTRLILRYFYARSWKTSRFLILPVIIAPWGVLWEKVEKIDYRVYNYR